MEDEKKKNSIFHRPKVIKTVKVEARNIFVPTSYYFAMYDDGSYSLYDGETFKYLRGNKKFNFGSMIKGVKETCKFQQPDALGNKFRQFYDAVNDNEADEQAIADSIAEQLGVKQHYLSSMYYYNPDNPKDNYIWENYKAMRKLFVDKCNKLGLEYEQDPNKIIRAAIEKIDANVDERFINYKNDLSYCSSVDDINKHFEEVTSKADSEYELSKIASDFAYTKQDIVEFPASFFSLNSRALIALYNTKKTDYELLQKYTEFLVALPTYCQIVNQLEKCSKNATKLNQRMKLERFYDNPEFIADLGELLDHDPEEVTYHFHATQGEMEAENVIKKGLYMYADRLDSTSFPEFSTNEVLQYGYGNSFTTFDDYIIVFAEPKDKQIIRRLTEEEKEQIHILPRRTAMMSKPSYVVDPEYIVGYVDKKNCRVINNDKFLYNKQNTGGASEK